MRKNHGFTLLEILLALLIGSVILTSIYGVFSAVSQTRNRLEAEGDVYHQARIFFDRLGGELGSLRVAPLGKQAVFSSGHDSNGNIYFEFNTERVSPLLRQHGGLSRVRYEVQQGDNLGTLFRSEQVLLADLAVSEPLKFFSGVKGFQLRYLRNGNWQESWTGKAPPQLVEVSLELVVDDRRIPFRSSFVLPGVK